MPKFRRLLPGLLLIVVLACGSGSEGAVSEDDEPAGLQAKAFAGRLIANPDGNYTMDDLVSVGYKKSKQFETDTLPHAQEVWYGFFKQKDIEVWVYENHEQALEFGVGPAEAAILLGRGQDLGPIGSGSLHRLRGIRQPRDAVPARITNLRGVDRRA